MAVTKNHAAESNRTLFVRNLPLTTTNESLQELFADVGPVKRCFVIKDKDSDLKSCKGYGYVTYSMPEDAAQALKTVKVCGSRKLHIAYSNKRTVKRDNTQNARFRLAAKKTPQQSTDEKTTKGNNNVVEEDSSDDDVPSRKNDKKKSIKTTEKFQQSHVKESNKKSIKSSQEFQKSDIKEPKKKPKKTSEEFQQYLIKEFNKSIKTTEEFQTSPIKESKEKKLSTDKKENDNSQISMSKSGTKFPLADLILTNMPAGTSEKNLSKYLRRINSIETVIFPVHQVDGGVGATVQFLHKAGAVNAMKTLAERKLNGKHELKIELKHVDKREKKIDPESTETHGVIIRNLSFLVNQDKLRKEFKKFGHVKRVYIPLKAGKKIGFGVVDFTNKTDASRAVSNMNGTEILGRKVAVDWAVKKDQDNVKDDEKVEGENDSNSEVDDEMEYDVDIMASDDDFMDDDDEEAEDNENKSEVDSESEADNESESEMDSKVMNDRENDSDNESDDDDDDDDDDEDDKDSMEDDSEEEVTKKTKKPRKRDLPDVPSDVKEGRTLFIRNLSYDTEEEDLEDLMSEFGQVDYCRIVIDPNTERSRGTAFVKFADKDEADKCLDKSTDEAQEGGVILDKRKLLISVALEREKAKELAKPKTNEKEDRRNLHLVREGMVRPGTQQAQGVSESDLAKRMKMDSSKRLKLKNPSIFISATRLSVHNIPTRISDLQLRAIFLKAASSKAARIVECRIMRDLERTNAEGLGKSRGYAFVAFTTHQHALAALKNTNNNQDLFDKNKRPIVEFSLENKIALEAKQRRLERNDAENPRGRGNKNAGKNAYAAMAPAPVNADGETIKLTKNMKKLPSHWGPKIRHNRPAPQKIPNKPKGKLSRKDSNVKRDSGYYDHQEMKPMQPANKKVKVKVTKPGNRKRKPDSDTFDKLVDHYKAKFRTDAKRGDWHN